MNQRLALKWDKEMPSYKGTREVIDWTAKDWSMDRLSSLLDKPTPTPTGSGNIIQEYTPLSDQGNIGSCVANAWCDMLEILQGQKDPQSVKQLSRLFLYWTARALTNNANEDGGTYLRSAAHQLLSVGAIEERYYPYIATEAAVLQVPPLNLFTISSDLKLDSYYRCTTAGPNQRLDQLEQAIMANQPFVFGTMVDQRFMDYDGSGTLTAPRARDYLGGHAMICIGVERMSDGSRRWVWRNSWGPDWGRNGYGYVDDKFMSQAEDIWIGILPA